ncbi:hypothetical protein SAMN05421755_104210 [Nitrosomonas sp. Nm33]|nr:hypothetical protein SAMN05421755_104210 [Nitrosomonas sp. Nm33]
MPFIWVTVILLFSTWSLSQREVFTVVINKTIDAASKLISSTAALIIFLTI